MNNERDIRLNNEQKRKKRRQKKRKIKQQKKGTQRKNIIENNRNQKDVIEKTKNK